MILRISNLVPSTCCASPLCPSVTISPLAGSAGLVRSGFGEVDAASNGVRVPGTGVCTFVFRLRQGQSFAAAPARWSCPESLFGFIALPARACAGCVASSRDGGHLHNSKGMVKVLVG